MKNSELSQFVELAREVLDVEREGIAAVRDRIDGEFSRALQILGECRGRVVVTGVGKSGLVGRKIAATLSSTGTPSFFLHPVEGAHGDMGMIRDVDVVLALSNSGRTHELLAILPALRSLGARVIAMTGCADSPLAEAADVFLDAGVPREACVMNLAPTASTTAALALGDALAVCLSRMKAFSEKDFRRFHPGGSLGQRLSLSAHQVMRTENLPAVSEAAPLREALMQLDEGGLGTVLLRDSGGKLSGILTDGDVRRLLCGGSFNPEAPVSTVMVAGPKAALPEQSLAELLDLMEDHAITVLPVVDSDGSLLGVLHLHDLLGKGHIRFTS